LLPRLMFGALRANRDDGISVAELPYSQTATRGVEVCAYGSERKTFMPDQDAMNRGTFVPPTPPTPKVRGSEDNPIEMGTGGVEEQKALDTMAGQPRDLPDMDDARGDVLLGDPGATSETGQTDNPLGTGVGYAGEGAASYGTQGATGEDARLGSTAHLTAEEMAEERQKGQRDVK